ncbi:hypothetical protein Tco_0989436 [Tanacetum coccineum]|uniref:MAK10-like protein n=1 Tax=Tanacetum coccineum TaxID=301880 RepID=A0ABQ5EV17_9ASTR
MGDENPIRTLGDYSKPSHEGYRNTMVYRNTIELPVGNNMVPIRFDTIRLVQNGCSFHGLRPEDPNQHLKDFLKLLDLLDLDGYNHHVGGSYYPIPCSIISTEKDRKTPQRYPDVPATSWRISIRSMNSFQGLTLKSLSSWHRPLASSPNFFMTMSISSQDKPLTTRSVNDPKDFAKPVEAIALPQDVRMVPTNIVLHGKTLYKPLSNRHTSRTEKQELSGYTYKAEQNNNLGDHLKRHGKGFTKNLRWRTT